MDRETFYDESRVAIVPMGFCYPGRLPNGGDAPPRPECAPLWRDRLLALMPEIRLTLLVGGYALTYVLGRGSMTEQVRAFRQHLPRYLPSAPSVLAHHCLGASQSLVPARTFCLLCAKKPSAHWPVHRSGGWRHWDHRPTSRRITLGDRHSRPAATRPPSRFCATCLRRLGDQRGLCPLHRDRRAASQPHPEPAHGLARARAFFGCLERLLQLALADYARTVGVDSVEQVSHLLMWRHTHHWSPLLPSPRIRCGRWT